MLQWYERDGYYKKRLLREIKFIQEYRSKVPNSFIEYSLLGKHFVVEYLFEYKGKRFIIRCIYPFLYPKVRIKVVVFEIKSKEKKVELLMKDTIIQTVSFVFFYIILTSGKKSMGLSIS